MVPTVFPKNIFLSLRDTLYDSFCSFVNNYIFYIACSLKYSQNVFIYYLPLYTSCLFYMLLNGNIVNIEKPDRVCSLNFVIDEFTGLFLRPSTFTIKFSRSA